MMDSETINNSLAVLKDIILPMESIVSSVTHQNIGIQSLKDVLLANLVILGITLLMNAHVVNFQDKSLVDNVSAHHQKLNGMMQPKLALVQLIHSVIIVFHVHHQDNGTHKLTLVYALLLKLNGMEPPVNAQQEDMVHNVLSALLQDIGTHKQINVFATNHLPGTETIVFVHNLTSFIKEDALTAQQVTIGYKTDAKNANAITKIWKF